MTLGDATYLCTRENTRNKKLSKYSRKKSVPTFRVHMHARLDSLQRDDSTKAHPSLTLCAPYLVRPTSTAPRAAPGTRARSTRAPCPPPPLRSSPQPSSPSSSLLSPSFGASTSASSPPSSPFHTGLVGAPAPG